MIKTDPETTLSISEEPQYAGLFQRVKALAIDWAVLLLVFVLSFNIIDFIGDAPGYVRGGILIFMFFLYDPLMVAFFGFTIGHYMMKLRVRDNDDHSKRIPFLLAFVRSALKGLLGILSFFSISLNDRRRALHDFASSAVVIEVK